MESITHFTGQKLGQRGEASAIKFFLYFWWGGVFTG